MLSGARRIAGVAAGLAILTGALAGCGGGSTQTKDAPIITVATGLWPLATAAATIGQGNVKIVDVVPAGTDPVGYRLSTSETAKVRAADVVVTMGGTMQPSVAAAAGNHTVVTLPPVGSDPYIWLNPHAMEAAGTQMAAAIEKADPKAKSVIRNGLDNLEADLSSLDVDYQSTLSGCPDTHLVTVDSDFAILSPRYPVTDKAIMPSGSTGLPNQGTIKHEISAIKASGASEIYDESWVPESDIIQATADTGVKVGSLDTLAGPPSGDSWPILPTGKKYFSLMEQNLGVISSALHCPNPATE
jgi:zinc transport system substrate-binding protein